MKGNVTIFQEVQLFALGSNYNWYEYEEKNKKYCLILKTTIRLRVQFGNLNLKMA